MWIIVGILLVVAFNLTPLQGFAVGLTLGWIAYRTEK